MIVAEGGIADSFVAGGIAGIAVGGSRWHLGSLGADIADIAGIAEEEGLVGGNRHIVAVGRTVPCRRSHTEAAVDDADSPVVGETDIPSRLWAPAKDSLGLADCWDNIQTL